MIRARITSGPSLSAATMVDFIEPPLGIRTEDPIRLGSPDVAFDPQGFPLEGSREITVPVNIYGTGAEVGQAMQRVARAISVPSRWLMMQRSQDTDPVWFRIRPESPGTLDLSSAYPRRGGEWTWVLTLTVDSTAVGERRAIPKVGTTDETATVSNDGLDRGFVIDPPGEAPVPLRVDVTPDNTYNGARPMLSVFSVPWDSPLVSTGNPSLIMEDTNFEAWGTGTTRITGHAPLTNGTGIEIPMDDTFRRSWAGGPSSSAPDGLPSWDLEPGRYLVLLRIYRAGTAGTLEVRMSQRWGGRDNWQPWRTWRPGSSDSIGSWLPVGYLQHPYGASGEGLEPSEIQPPFLHFQRRALETWTSHSYLDQVAFVPVDLARGSAEVAMMSQFESGVGAGGTISWRFDSEYRRVSVVDGFGQTHSAPAPLRTGGWPVAVPGMATGVSIFLDTSDAPVNRDLISTMTDVSISGAPRQLHLGQER